MSHRTRERPAECLASLPLNYDRSAARSTRELVHSLQMYCKLLLVAVRVGARHTAAQDAYNYGVQGDRSAQTELAPTGPASRRRSLPRVTSLAFPHSAAFHAFHFIFEDS
ncbi:hypothetical protein EVAR_26400_1 [Eumeta japonica]|uniref:Uncharacterized protein n=1 Tax=Eumeta variegata TaxID=151549 RepID=A0A4C1VQV3_EUMVA|nr:hypothetical protein EVAR_26400_1 [Eumeta japonica]